MSENGKSYGNGSGNTDKRANQKDRRVVVTGIGAITPLGNDPETFWANVQAGKSGIGPITLFDTQEHQCTIAGEVKDFDPADYMDKKEARRMDRYMQFAVAAAKQAYEDSGLTPESVDPERFSAIIGTGSGGIGTIEAHHKEVLVKGFRRVSPFFVSMMICDMAAGRISQQYNAQGPNMAVVTACATGTDSIGNAFRMIHYGETDVAFAGGAEAAITPMSIAGFSANRALSFSNDDPEGASRPFDIKRDGFVMGEGSCLLILEELEHAKKRGAKIYGEIIGYGRSSDAHDIVAPPPDGRGAASAMRRALADAGMDAAEVMYINAHATSTPQGDIAETNAIKTVFGERVKNGLLVSGTKSMTGHMIGSAGSAEALITLLALRDQVVPPTINVKEQDPECDMDIVPNVARKVENFKIAMSNSFGFGGHNSALLFRRWEGE